jgi:hypothetical protein
MSRKQQCHWGADEYSPGAFSSWIMPCYNNNKVLLINNWCKTRNDAIFAAYKDLTDKRTKHESSCTLSEEEKIRLSFE